MRHRPEGAMPHFRYRAAKRVKQLWTITDGPAFYSGMHLALPAHVPARGSQRRLHSMLLCALRPGQLVKSRLLGDVVLPQQDIAECRTTRVTNQRDLCCGSPKVL
ncbi:hypothetical protein NDU88_006060 [Pleurodeles waltl]|uniref:Uncharacterized protein n=1 Tax=Pleurodeles waltl TaxID=8319 RepID=A0AAV7UKH5_PLEWA|nr:hypothetical protein NDU88_006060 [Pleurodeles waltl]